MFSNWMKSLLALAGTLLAACEGGSGEGSVTLLLTDGPEARLEQAVVTISQVYLQPADENEPRVILRDMPFTTDLAALTNDAETLVDAAVVPNGEYAQLRFVVDGAYIVVDDEMGTRVFATEGYAVPPGLAVDGELQTTSWDTSGLKVQLPDDGVTVEGNQRILLVDFDLAESFGHEAREDKWVMHPVLEAIDLELTATIAVEVEMGPQVLATDLEGFRARLVDADAQMEAEIPLINEDQDAALEASFRYVDPREGPFTLAIDAPSGVVFTTEPSSVVTVVAESGMITEVSLRIVSVQR